MAETQLQYDEQTIYLGNGWTLRARIQQGLVQSPPDQGASWPPREPGMMGAYFKVVQFAVITEQTPLGVNISNEDARTLLAWREALGPNVPLTHPEKAAVRGSSPPTDRAVRTSRTTSTRRT